MSPDGFSHMCRTSFAARHNATVASIRVDPSIRRVWTRSATAYGVVLE
jgi:hypothetical protein